MRPAARVAFDSIAVRFSDGAPSLDLAPCRARYPALDAWPADAQLALALLAWTLGPGFALPGFVRALSALPADFGQAARAVPLGSFPTFVTLGGIARRGLCNASHVVAWNLDPDFLYWPWALSAPHGATLSSSAGVKS